MKIPEKRPPVPGRSAVDCFTEFRLTVATNVTVLVSESRKHHSAMSRYLMAAFDENSERVRGNRPDSTSVSWDDMRRILIADLHSAIEILEGE
jgi:hypothetical protein